LMIFLFTAKTTQGNMCSGVQWGFWSFIFFWRKPFGVCGGRVYPHTC
jgi:hypothetical protein